MAIRKMTLPLLGIALCLAQWPAAAQDYPRKPVQVILTTPAGNAADTIGRLILSRVEKIIGQPIVIENRGGASGTVAVRTVADAAPDGYTILFGSSTAVATGVVLYKDLPYDPLKDIAPISRLTKGGVVLAVGTNFPAKTIKEFTDYIRTHPGKTYGSTGLTTGGAFATAAFLKVADLKMRHVPYSTATQALTDLANGDVDSMFYLAGALMPFVESGKLRLLATTDVERTADVPNVPTLAESGFAGFSSLTWTAAFAPKGTPQAVIDKLDAAFKQAVADPTVAAQILKATGHSPFYGSSSELKAYQVDEIERSRQLAKDLGITLQ